MKKTRRIAAMVAAMALAATMAVPSMMMSASAATAETVTINNEQGEQTAYTHKYTVYKIFNGTVSEGALEGISFAKANGFDAFLEALQRDASIGSDFTSAKTEAAVAKTLSGYENDGAKANAFAKFVANNTSLVSTVDTSLASPISLTQDGYYLIVEDATTGTPTDVGMTSYLLTQYDASVGADINAKAGIPSVEKKIQENEDGKVTTVAAYGENYNDTADFCIGDTVPFELIGTLPDNISSYSSYKYIFHDTLNSAFTSNNDFVVTVVNGDETKTVNTASYNRENTATATNTAITVTFNDLLNVKDEDGNAITINKDSKVYVNYTAVLNSNAEIGRTGQQNKVYLEYSNNPDKGGEGTTSKTPEDQVVAFTYELDVNKIDSVSKAALDGAQFALYKTVGEVNYYAAIDASKNTIIDWIPGSFNENATFTKTAGGENLNGTGTTEASLTSGSSFRFVGLDDGTYMLKEVVAPNGYNKLASDIEVEIIANTQNGQNQDGDGTELIRLELKVDSKSELVFDASTVDNADTDVNEYEQNLAGLRAGALSFDVENKSGSTLPSTGGMGTTLFILGGGVTAGLAAIYLISKKRAKNAE